MMPFIAGIVGVLMIVAIILVLRSQGKYMKKEQETGANKKALHDLMREVMGEKFELYTYLVGYYTKIKSNIGSTTYYYFPYILAFGGEGLIVFPFIKQQGKLYIRNQLPVDPKASGMKFKASEKKIAVEFKIGGEKLPIFTNPVIKSMGTENSDRPIGIYQEQEYKKFWEYLPGFMEGKNSK